MDTVVEKRKKYDLDRITRIVITIICVVAGIYVMDYLSSVLLPFLVACLLAYMLNPLVEWTRRTLHVKNRVLPTVVTLVVVLAVIVGALVLLIPYITSEVEGMTKMLARYAKSELTVPHMPVEVQEYIRQYANAEQLSTLLSKDQWGKVAEFLTSNTMSVLGGTMNALLAVLSWLIVLLYLLFILIDYDKITRAIKGAVPGHYRRLWMRVVQDVAKTMSHYFRGQALVSLIVGIIFAIEFQIIGLPMAIVFGLLIGVLNMVPYLQLISIPFAALLCFVMSVTDGGSFWVLFAEVIAAYCICQLIQDLILTPKIMGHEMGLNPAVIFLALSIWSYLLGFVGLIVALPFTTLILSYYSEFVLHSKPTARSL